MTIQTTTQTKTRRSLLLGLGVGVALAGVVALGGTAQKAVATFPGNNARIAFDSDRTTGTGVDNPTGDFEVFTIRPDGTGLKQITHNTVADTTPVFSPTARRSPTRAQAIRPPTPRATGRSTS